MPSAKLERAPASLRCASACSSRSSRCLALSSPDLVESQILMSCPNPWTPMPVLSIYLRFWLECGAEEIGDEGNENVDYSRLCLLCQPPLHGQRVKSAMEPLAHILHEIDAGSGGTGVVVARAASVASRRRRLIRRTASGHALWGLRRRHRDAAIAVVRSAWAVVAWLLRHCDGQRGRGVGGVIGVSGRHVGWVTKGRVVRR